MRLFWLFSLLSLSLSGFGQAQFGWGVEVFPNFSNRRLVAGTSISREEVRRLENLETWRPSYSAGLFAQWRGDRAGFQTGLRFLDAGYRTDKQPLEASDNPPPNATEKRLVTQHLFIEAPAELQFFQELDSKNDFFFMTGLSIAYNIANNSKTVFYNNETREVRSESLDKNEIATIGYSFLSSVGWEHHFTERFTLVVQPTFQFWLKALYLDTDLNRNLYAVGLRLGAKFQ